MSKSSSARFLPYDLRPAKQTERRLLLDYIGCAKEGGISVSSLRYVGMGGVKFYDFVLMHKFVGISNMTSLEHDRKMVPRCQFNRPYDFIRVLPMTCSEFLQSEDLSEPTVYWLDYDGALSDGVISDIQSLGVRAAPSSFIFVTVMAGVPSDLVESKERERLDSLVEQFGSLAEGLNTEDMEERNFRNAVHQILLRALIDAFAARTDGYFAPHFQVAYGDGAPMLTVGGFFGEREVSGRIESAVASVLPFLIEPARTPYVIGSFNLTERERALFEFACSTESSTVESNRLVELGFKQAQIQSYREVLRFVPRYFEAII